MDLSLQAIIASTWDHVKLHHDTLFHDRRITRSMTSFSALCRRPRETQQRRSRKENIEIKEQLPLPLKSSVKNVEKLLPVSKFLCEICG